MMQESDTSFNKGYAYFYDMFYEKKNYNQELDCIKKVLKERNLDLNGKQILEIGCGTGNFSVNLQPNNSLTAIDPSSEMIKIAKNKFKSMQSNFYQLSISEFNLLNNDSKKFDVIVQLLHVLIYLIMNYVVICRKIYSVSFMMMIMMLIMINRFLYHCQVSQLNELS